MIIRVRYIKLDSNTHVFSAADNLSMGLFVMNLNFNIAYKDTINQLKNLLLYNHNILESFEIELVEN